MGKRFSRLEDAKRKGRTGDKITNYKNWKADGRPATAGGIVPPAKGASIKKALLPFYGSGFTGFAVIKISGRAYGSLATVGLTEAKLNLENVEAEPAAGSTNTYEPIDGFSPAKAVLFVPGTGSTPTKSGITGGSYKKRNGTTYTIPFGKKDAAGKRDEKSMRGQVLGGVLAGIGVSFKEEVYVP